MARKIHFEIKIKNIAGQLFFEAKIPFNFLIWIKNKLNLLLLFSH